MLLFFHVHTFGSEGVPAEVQIRQLQVHLQVGDVVMMMLMM